mmetsp:Transcript_2460/g.3512  ORF Transcript_2460/g.3512 Transcript_2460/m.3512 type:complete len:108 (-) Transcript_2460:46-369(-)
MFLLSSFCVLDSIIIASSSFEAKDSEVEGTCTEVDNDDGMYRLSANGIGLTNDAAVGGVNAKTPRLLLSYPFEFKDKPRGNRKCNDFMVVLRISNINSTKSLLFRLC